MTESEGEGLDYARARHLLHDKSPMGDDDVEFLGMVQDGLALHHAAQILLRCSRDQQFDLRIKAAGIWQEAVDTLQARIDSYGDLP